MREAVVVRASKLDVKWLGQERRAVEHLFHMNRLYCILQEEKELGTSPTVAAVDGLSLTQPLVLVGRHGPQRAVHP